MNKKDIKVNVLKGPIPVSLEPIKMILFGKEVEGILYEADVLEHRATIIIPIGKSSDPDVITVDKIFPELTFGMKLDKLRRNFLGLIEDHEEELDELKNAMDYDYDVSDSIRNVIDGLESIMEYIEENKEGGI
jgi:hypothetical protein